MTNNDIGDLIASTMSATEVAQRIWNAAQSSPTPDTERLASCVALIQLHARLQDIIIALKDLGLRTGGR